MICAFSNSSALWERVGNCIGQFVKCLALDTGKDKDAQLWVDVDPRGSSEPMQAAVVVRGSGLIKAFNGVLNDPFNG